MRKKTNVIILSAVVATAAAVPALARAGNGDQDANETEKPITGPGLERASQAALDHLGGGRVTATEVEDEDSYYEVEVTLDDGSQVDVQLDQDFSVVGSDDDREDD
jgi:uncharacterized membrane protein YkoI